MVPRKPLGTSKDQKTLVRASFLRPNETEHNVYSNLKHSDYKFDILLQKISFLFCKTKTKQFSKCIFSDGILLSALISLKVGISKPVYWEGQNKTTLSNMIWPWWYYGWTKLTTNKSSYQLILSKLYCIALFVKSLSVFVMLMWFFKPQREPWDRVR